MTMMLALRYFLIVTFLGLTAWGSLLHRLHSGLWLVSMLAGLFFAVVAAERERIIRETPPAPDPSDPASRSGEDRPLRALIVGAGEVGQMLAAELAADGRHQVVGFVDDEVEGGPRGDQVILGRREATAVLIDAYAIDEIFLAYTPTWQQQLAEDLVTSRPNVRLHIVPSPYEAMMHIGRVGSFGDVAIVPLITRTRQRSELVKRLCDLTVALVSLLLLAPFLLLLAVLIKLTSRGPAIFAQERVGRYGRPFILYKFRTMVSDAEARTGPVLSSGKKDSRLTAIGRWLRLFRLDEIPQLWNVLRGEMSLVGPRPERTCFVNEFERAIPAYAKRHEVRPGITGLAQVMAGYHTDARDKLRFDLIYVSHQSLWLDLTILLRTVTVCCFPPKR